MGENERKSVNRIALHSGIWYTVSSFLLKALSLISTPIFTRLMSKTDYGDFSVYLSALGILAAFSTLNVNAALPAAKYDYKDRLDSYISSVMVLGGLSTLFILAIVAVVGFRYDSFFGVKTKYYIVGLIYLFFSCGIELFQNRERLFYGYKVSVSLSVFLAVFTLVLSVLLVTQMQDKLEGRVLGNSLPTCMLGLVLCYILLKRSHNIDLSMWKYTIPICLPYIPHILSLTVLGTIDRIMISLYSGADAAAIYSVAYTTGHAVSILMTSLNTAYVPWLVDKLAEDRYAEIRKFSYVYLSGFCFLSLGIMLFAPEILMILGGKAYMEGVYILIPISMSSICQFVYIMFVNIEQIKKKTIGMAFASISAAALNFLLNLIFIPKFGYVAAAYTTLVGYIWLMLIHMVLVKRIKYDHVYNYRFIVIMVFVTMLASMCINMLYSANSIRYILIGVYTVILFALFYKNRRDIIGFIKK